MEFYTHSEMVADLEKINRSIAISGWKPNAILGISRGGLIPAVHLSHYWDVPLETCQVSLRDEKHIDRTNKLMPLTIFNLLEMSKNILVVDDICDSGKTFEYIYNYYAKFWCDNEYAKTLMFKHFKTAALIHNEGQNVFQTDYYGKKINKYEDDTWINFPWEFSY